jgi:hypothetical protein
MSIDLYEVRLRKDHRGVDVSSDALPFGRLWYGEPDAISNSQKDQERETKRENESDRPMCH